MRIGFLSQPFDVVEPPVDGRYSIPVLTFNFAKELAARGHDVTVYATTARAAPRRSREFDRLANHGIVHFSRPRRLRQLAMAVLRRLSQLGRRRLPFMVSAWFDPLYALQAALDARARGLQIIHIQNFSQYAHCFKAICPGIKVVLHMHCEWLNQIDRATIRARLRKVDRILCTSEYIRAQAGQALPEFAGRMRTLYNGVDVQRFTPRAELPEDHSQSVYFIGRIAPDKGVHLLIEAFERVLEAVPALGCASPARPSCYPRSCTRRMTMPCCAPPWVGSTRPAMTPRGPTAGSRASPGSRGTESSFWVSCRTAS